MLDKKVKTDFWSLLQVRIAHLNLIVILQKAEKRKNEKHPQDDFQEINSWQICLQVYSMLGLPFRSDSSLALLSSLCLK